MRSRSNGLYTISTHESTAMIKENVAEYIQHSLMNPEVTKIEIKYDHTDPDGRDLVRVAISRGQKYRAPA